MIKVISKTGKIYYYPNYYKKKRPQPSPNKRVSKSGKVYYCSYKPKLVDGRIKANAPKSRCNAKRCLERDHNVCTNCGGTKHLDVHHIDNNGIYRPVDGKANNDLSNLLTLCHKCHMGLHFGVRCDPVIKELRENGLTFQKIANRLGISRQRVHQIYSKNIYLM